MFIWRSKKNISTFQLKKNDLSGVMGVCTRAQLFKANDVVS